MYGVVVRSVVDVIRCGLWWWLVKSRGRLLWVAEVVLLKCGLRLLLSRPVSVRVVARLVVEVKVEAEV